jgi:hypothetical protein
MLDLRRCPQCLGLLLERLSRSTLLPDKQENRARSIGKTRASRFVCCHVIARRINGGKGDPGCPTCTAAFRAVVDADYHQSQDMIVHTYTSMWDVGCRIHDNFEFSPGLAAA